LERIIELRPRSAPAVVARWPGSATTSRSIGYVDINISDKMLRSGLCCGGSGFP
jgi:hypothetical protein